MIPRSRRLIRKFDDRVRPTQSVRRLDAAATVLDLMASSRSPRSSLAPVEKPPDCQGVGHACVPVPDVGREELDEALAAQAWRQVHRKRCIGRH
jgi:hypothetical protein